MITLGPIKKTPGILGNVAQQFQSQFNYSSLFLPVVSGLAGIYCLTQTAQASGGVIHPTPQEWPFNGKLGLNDAASVRRGFEVYRQVCYTCHSVKSLRYRHLIDVIYTKEQAKALANSVKVRDGPNDKGEYFERKGTLTDPFPKPYENDQAARDANGGALPPDLSLVLKARHGQADYIFSILTGYRDRPVGVEERKGSHYNPYYHGNFIAMRPVLQDGGVEYEDGTPATISQQAKDVVCFLHFAGDPKFEDRKVLGISILSGLVLMVIGSGYMKRRVWSIHKSRKLSFTK